MRSTGVSLLLSVCATTGVSSVIPRQEFSGEQTFPTDAPPFQDKSVWITRVLQTGIGFNQSMRDEGYSGTCTVLYSATMPDMQPRPCDSESFQWQFTGWTNESVFNYTINHALQDESGAIWIKSVGGSINVPSGNLINNTHFFQLDFEGARKADDQSLKGDVFPKPADP